ncbi:MAG TPA: single-stranded DNA-binding protein [Ilumatobacter sp.]|nr:single-stranded DNA-binding protein [Ilumatobacter sp.]
MLKFTLYGRLAADPEFTTYGDNAPMARLRVASHHPGSAHADFFTVAVFDPPTLAQLANAHKGDPLRLDGSARQHRWVTQHDDQREQINLVARTVEHHQAHWRSAGQHTALRTATAQAGR